MDTYEESVSVTFELTNATDTLRDRFSFYGPLSAGQELAARRASLYDATTIHAIPGA